MKARRWFASVVVCTSLVLLGTNSLADSVAVPFGLQVELFAKVAGYDKTLPGRADGVVRVAVLTRAGSAESISASAHVLSALSNMARVAGLPHEDASAEFVDVPSVVALCRSRKLSILYVPPGFADVTESLAKALVGIPVMTVSATSEDVTRGMILGFDLAGGKPKLFVNITSSRNQGVQLSADVLKIATVVQ